MRDKIINMLKHPLAAYSVNASAGMDRVANTGEGIMNVSLSDKASTVKDGERISRRIVIKHERVKRNEVYVPEETKGDKA